MTSVKALAHEIRQSRTSAVAALNEHLDVIDEMEGEINAFNIVNRDIAMESAQKIDDLINDSKNPILP